MPLNNIEKNVKEKIKEGNIKPLPKKFFVLKNYIFWLLSILSFIVGSFSVAGIIFSFQNSEWELYEKINESFFIFTIEWLPAVWFLLLLLLIGFSVYNIHNTKYGYKYRMGGIIAISIILSIVGGFILYYRGVGEAMNRYFIEKMPEFNRIIDEELRLWSRPEEGFLAGRVIEINGNSILLEGNNGIYWEVLPYKFIRDESGADVDDRYIDSEFDINPGLPIKLIGTVIEENTFMFERIILATDDLDWYQGHDEFEKKIRDYLKRKLN